MVWQPLHKPRDVEEDNDDAYGEVLPSFKAGTPAQLNQLHFMDIYVQLDADTPAHFREGVSRGMTQQDAEVPPEFQADVAGLRAMLREKFTRVEMGFTYGGMRLRASKLLTATGATWAALRRIPAMPPALEKLGFVPQLPPVLREIGQRSGLILLCGATGQGKTTTSSSLLLEYLKWYGGVAFTIEDPVEYVLEGRHGTGGYCYQSEISEEPEWGEMLKRSLRWHPRYIFVGEVRTPDATNQLLRAATSGHTVITTMHAGSMEEALEGLLQLGEQAIGERASLLLATGLTAVLHQSFSPPFGLNAHFMVTEADNAGSPIRNMIREKRIGQTRSFADTQMALLMKEGKLFKNQSR